MPSEKKQIEATIRNKVAAQYREKIRSYEERLNRLSAMFEKEQERRIKAELELEPLREKVEQYEDWINRLQEFVNMPDGTREREFKVYMDELKSREHLQEIEKMFRVFTSHLF